MRAPSVAAVSWRADDYRSGYPNSDYNFWMGSYAPAKTSPEIVQRLNAEVRNALQMPEIKSRILTLGGEVDPGDGMTVAQFDDFIAKERAADAEIVKLIHYQPQCERPPSRTAPVTS